VLSIDMASQSSAASKAMSATHAPAAVRKPVAYRVSLVSGGPDPFDRVIWQASERESARACWRASG